MAHKAKRLALSYMIYLQRIVFYSVASGIDVRSQKPRYF